MLGRAVQNYAPPPFSQAKKPTSGHQVLKPATLHEGHVKGDKISAQNSMNDFTPSSFSSISKSIIHKASVPQRASPNAGVVPRKRTSSAMGGLVAALHKADSFQDATNTSTVREKAELPHKSSSLLIDSFGFDPNDFEDDAELNLDIQYPLPLPSTTVSRDPLLPLSANISLTSTPHVTAGASTSKPSATQSSVPWSSSPLSHKRTPPGALMCRRMMEGQEPIAPRIAAETSPDGAERPAKRRTVPWRTRNAQEEALQSAAIVEVSTTHEGQETDKTTPFLKRLAYPWNTTLSAVKNQQKAFKDLQKRSNRQKDGATTEEMQEASIILGHDKANPICLTDEQNEVLNLVTKQKRSVFFTGSAGTGKSVLMRSIIKELKKIYVREPDRVAVTASTGLAACNIGGVTLHSFAGIGLGKESVDELRKKIMRNQKHKQRWLRTQVLIIDEISMVDGDLFDKLEALARLIRKNGRPFGGIQIVVTGDFFQLPPVPDHGQRAKFAFDAGTWTTAIHHTIRLTEVFRQRDPAFANMLNEMRIGKISEATVQAFKRLNRPIKHEDALEATELFPTRREVDNANAFKMRSLQGKSYFFKALDSGTIKDTEYRTKMLKDCIAPPELELKKGSQVMLIKNIDDNLVNGSLGTVIAFMNKKNFEIYDQEPALPDDIPDDAASDESKRKFIEVKNKLDNMRNKELLADTGNLYPLVRFRIADGTSRDLLCQPEEWKVELPNGEIPAMRVQVPLILAWALSIHKAQGQTMSLVKVDLRRVFEKGQAYVALSRATTQEGLCVMNFNRNAVMAHPRVAEFYNGLYSVNDAIQRVNAASKSVGKDTKGGVRSKQQNMSQYEYDDEEEAMAAYA